MSEEKIKTLLLCAAASILVTGFGWWLVDLHGQVRDNTKEFPALKAEVADLKGVVADLKDELGKIDNRLDEIRETVVYFHGHASVRDETVPRRQN